MAFSEHFYEQLDAHTLIGIRGGTERETFLDIWILRVGERVFARSWTRKERSWFTAFQAEGKGAIRIGEEVFPVTGRHLEPDAAIHADINQAYLDKYSQPGNLKYAEGIIEPEFKEVTMEFFYDGEA